MSSAMTMPTTAPVEIGFPLIVAEIPFEFLADGNAEYEEVKLELDVEVEVALLGMEEDVAEPARERNWARV